VTVTGYAALRAGDAQPRICARTDAGVTDLVAALDAGALRLPDELDAALRAPALGPLMTLGAPARAEIDVALAGLGEANEPSSGTGRDGFAPPAGAEPVLPFTVADYTDFFASRHHAANCGRMLRPDGDPLTPNWEWMPVGYHGRSGTVLVSGTPVRRPRGQVFGAEGGPQYGPSAWLDVEVELGVVIGVPSVHGEPVAVERAEEHIFGLVALNDWSARDIQAWESQPLGPHLGKSFATSISGWVIPWEAVARTEPAEPAQHVLEYLCDAPGRGLDVDVELRINGQLVSSSNALQLAWTPAQLVAHLTANGAQLRTGDLLGTGTISGPEPESRGCLLERTWAGREPLTLGDGSVRTWLEDGDEVTIAAGPADAPLAEVRGHILPAR
jgi:fumarylacetoacetase